MLVLAPTSDAEVALAAAEELVTLTSAEPALPLASLLPAAWVAELVLSSDAVLELEFRLAIRRAVERSILSGAQMPAAFVARAGQTFSKEHSAVASLRPLSLPARAQLLSGRRRRSTPDRQWSEQLFP